MQSQQWVHTQQRVHLGRPSSARSRRSTCVTYAAQVTRRVRLIKQRPTLPARQRRRDKYQDVPRLQPALRVQDAPEFAGRVLVAINSANGPRQLLALVQQCGHNLQAQHVVALLSRLAGFATRGALKFLQVQDQQQCTQRCVQLLRALLPDATTLELSKAAYSLHRLGVYDKALMDGVVTAAYPLMSAFKADALAGLVAAVGGLRHSPPKPWLDRVCLETYIRLPSFSAQDVANVAFGLASVRCCPSEAWLERAQRRFREAVEVSGQGAGGPGAHPPSFVKFAWALVQCQVQPPFNWMLFFTGEVRRRLDMYTARELSTLLWAIQRLGHTPDPLFTEAWFRVAARTLPTCPPASLLTALHSLALLGGRLPPSERQPLPGKYLAALLPRAQVCLHEHSAGELVQLLWCLVVLRVKPTEAWMDAYLTAAEGKDMGELGPGQLSDAAWCFAQLQFQPSEAWEEQAMQQVTRQLPVFSQSQLGLLLWAWRAVQLTPVPAWEAHLMLMAQATQSPEQLQRLQALCPSLAGRGDGLGPPTGPMPRHTPAQQLQPAQPHKTSGNGTKQPSWRKPQTRQRHSLQLQRH